MYKIINALPLNNFDFFLTFKPEVWSVKIFMYPKDFD